MRNLWTHPLPQQDKGTLSDAGLTPWGAADTCGHMGKTKAADRT